MTNPQKNMKRKKTRKVFKDILNEMKHYLKIKKIYDFFCQNQNYIFLKPWKTMNNQNKIKKNVFLLLVSDRLDYSLAEKAD